MIRVVSVKGMKVGDRPNVCYVGRATRNGWPTTPWGNHQFDPCPDGYRERLLGLPAGDLDKLLAELWEACEHGAKPLGCWCCDWNGEGVVPGCHAAVWAELLLKQYGGHEAEKLR